MKRWFFGAAMLLGLVLVGCSQGSYPVDIFYEQHYQQSYRSGEPPRLTGMADAVAFYPPPASSVTNSGADLYRVNCQMCHGADAKGTGPVLTKMRDGYGYEPIVDPNLTTRPPSFIESRLGATARPLGPTSVMPPFGKLLNEDERHAIAQYIGSLPK
ncbi:MAG: cytochrome c [Chloroflexi bacterium]|nr:cytochrome c [Chloroflexota bacterium]